MDNYDTLFLNGNFHSLVHEGEKFEAIAVKKGIIEKTYLTEPGNPHNIAKNIIDLEGKSIIPGLIDSHFHFMASAALNEIALNVSEIDSKNHKIVPHNLDGFMFKLQEFAKNQDSSLPILCFNYIISAMDENRLPYQKELDEWVPGRYIIVISMDGHSSSHSEKSLKYMRFDPTKSNGILTGEDHEFNLGKINELVLKSLTTSIVIKSVQNLVNDAARHGITCIHCLDGFDDLENDKTLWFLSRFGRFLPLDLRLFPQLLNPEKISKYLPYMSYKRMGGCGAWEQDGSVGSQTAAFEEEYADDPGNNGKIYYQYDQMDAYVKKGHDLGFQITSHAIGPRAIDVILHAFDKVIDRSVNKPKRNMYRHRIDHFEFPTQEQVNLAIDDLDLVITAQPGYSWMDEEFQKAYRRYLQPNQFDMQIPLKTIYEKGGCLCGSSDSPVQHLNPFVQIQGLVDFPVEKERLNMFQALRSYTYNGAYSIFEENIRGTLEVGKLADLVVLDKNPFKIPTKQTFNLKVEKTFIKGKKFKDMNMSMIGFLSKYIFTKKRKI